MSLSSKVCVEIVYFNAYINIKEEDKDGIAAFS